MRRLLVLVILVVASCSESGSEAEQVGCAEVAVGSLRGHDGYRTLDIWRLGSRLRPVAPLTSDHASSDASISNDGEWIVYATGRGSPRDPETGPERWALYMMRTDGTGDRQATEGPHDRWPDWSPDGKHLVFRRGREGGTGGIVIRKISDGTERMLVTDQQEIFTAPRWSPASSAIALETFDLGRSRQVVVVLDSKTGAELLRIDGATDATWSPTGDRLAVQRRGPAGRPDPHVEIFDVPEGTSRTVPRSHTQIATVFAWTTQDGLQFARNVRGPGYELVAWKEKGEPQLFDRDPKLETYDEADVSTACAKTPPSTAAASGGR